MKLYAIRDKETGKLLDYQQEDGKWVLVRDIGVVWVDGPLNGIVADASKELKNDNLETITLRIEPTEPCHECKERPWVVGTNQWGEQEEHEADWEFCPYCGRSLT